MMAKPGYTQARVSIGIDLGTTNSALAFVPLFEEAKAEVLSVPQWENLASLAEEPILPSFLYLPEDAVAAQLRGKGSGAGEWIVGRFARKKVADTPGRVVHSAKSWLCHHRADRSAPFLPWASDDLTPAQKISPLRASALILNYFRGSWNSRFAAAGFPFDDQEITVTVPASFDAAAQRLTLVAAEEAGFPDGVRLLEEPQAAFYCWLEQHEAAHELWRRLADRDGARSHHVLVVDIGGGTSDFSLFELRQNASNPIPDIRRIAVSEHILLGGDNIDLAIAHLLEPRFVEAGGQLSGAQWAHLIAACCDLKESVLSGAGPPDERFTVALPGRGSRLIAGSQTVAVTRAEIEQVLLDGFFPECAAQARPYRTQAALREWGLPFATDGAITRHLAEFLNGRPPVDAVLFNGGSLYPAPLRQTLCAQIGTWQDGNTPLVLENTEPALAVARGAARFGKLLHHQTARITAGAARAIFLEVQRTSDSDDEASHSSLVCVLPRDAPPEMLFEIADPPLELRTNRLVRFQAYSSSRHGRSRAGDVLEWRESDFHALPPLQTTIKTAEPFRFSTSRTVPIRLTAKMNALGLLQISCVSADPEIQQAWPLEFNLRPHEQLHVSMAGGVVQAEPNATASALSGARGHIESAFARSASKTQGITAATILKSLEPIIGRPRYDWNAGVLRALWPALEERPEHRGLSPDHEEAWLMLAGFLLRPGFGVPGDDLRIDALWRLRESGPRFPGKRSRLQEYILWRRVAGGLTRERQEELLASELSRIRAGKAPAELVRLLGSLELISHAAKTELVDRFIDTATKLARAKQHCAPYFAALALLLNRAPLYAGPETVLPPELVERAYAAFRGFDWSEPELLELQTLFLNAARVVGDRNLDLPKPVRNQIATKLEKSGVSPLRTARVREFTPIARSDRASLYGEALPMGLLLGVSQEES